jgi:hypothetical protein
MWWPGAESNHWHAHSHAVIHGNDSCPYRPRKRNFIWHSAYFWSNCLCIELATRVWIDHAQGVLTEIYIEALLVDETLN